MRNISFALTPDQVLDQSKDVTRRTGWKTLQVGTLLQPVRKAQGLRKGEHVEKLGGPIRVVAVRREFLDRLTADLDYGFSETVREGFAGSHERRWPSVCFEFFCRTHGCEPHAWVTRIEFEYTQPVVSRERDA